MIRYASILLDIADGTGKDYDELLLEQHGNICWLQTSHGVRHLGMGASSPKMRIEKRKPTLASVSSFRYLRQNLRQKFGEFRNLSYLCNRY
jgi:hypothetical protein